MSQIINYGSCCIDHVFQIPHFVRAGETLSSAGYAIFPGGKGLNQSIAVAEAGCAVSHVGAVGEDGRWLAELMTARGVNITHLGITNTPTGQAILQIDPSGENAIIILGGANLAAHEHLIDAALNDATGDEILLIQNETSGNEAAIRQAKAKGLQVAFNMAPMNANARALPLALIDYFIINETEGEALTGKTEPSEICDAVLDQYPHSAVVLTLGPAGVLFRTAERNLSQPAYPVETVDTTGAGDTFTGYFLATLMKTQQVELALQTAAAAAALSVTQPGAATSIPTLHDVNQFLATRAS
ncbi:MAG: ribokinase [Gammaproteobacteria bacterium]|nr:ribokinase [Gammaproteobacteria bacterium]